MSLCEPFLNYRNHPGLTGSLAFCVQFYLVDLEYSVNSMGKALPPGWPGYKTRKGKEHQSLATGLGTQCSGKDRGCTSSGASNGPVPAFSGVSTSPLAVPRRQPGQFCSGLTPECPLRPPHFLRPVASGSYPEGFCRTGLSQQPGCDIER